MYTLYYIYTIKSQDLHWSSLIIIVITVAA